MDRKPTRQSHGIGDENLHLSFGRKLTWEAYVVKHWGLEMKDTVENISAQSSEVREEETATHRDNRYQLRLWAENYN